MYRVTRGSVRPPCPPPAGHRPPPYPPFSPPAPVHFRDVTVPFLLPPSWHPSVPACPAPPPGVPATSAWAPACGWKSCCELWTSRRQTRRANLFPPTRHSPLPRPSGA
eukprot:scaffold8635_cov93-Isochrysis_galbana.AAC.3